MAGKVQHEIPQLFLRGFLIPDNRGAEQVFVYRRGQSEPYKSGIDRAAAEGYFYSELSKDGSRTLDDEITEYERRLGLFVAELRALPPGGIANSTVAAEVVAHLTTRNAHFRGAFTHAVRSIADGARTLFGTRDAVLRFLGLDEAEPGSRFCERFAKVVDQYAPIIRTGFPGPVLERLAFFIAKENFFSETAGPITPMLAMLQELEKKAPRLAREGHNNALSKSFVPDVRVAQLGSFEWQTEAAEADLILPDCVALGLVPNGTWHPLMMVNAAEVTAVVFPLNARMLLIGRTQYAPTIDIFEFNQAAAACSQTYFLSGSRSDEVRELQRSLGSRALTIVEKAVRSGVSEFFPVSPIDPEPDQQLEQQTNQQPAQTKCEALEAPGPITVIFRGDFDEALRASIAKATGQRIAEACWTIPLGRLDGITFADDYREGLRTLDRGFPVAKPLEPYQTDTGSGIAQAPMVLRNGVLKGHVVLDGALARCIIGDNATYRAFAVHVLVNQLAHVGCTEIFDEAMPGVLLRPIEDRFDNDRQSCVWPGWYGYFAARASAAFNPGHGKLEAEVLTSGLREAQTAIPTARLAYRQHGDLERLLQEILPRIAFILEHAGDLLGHADSLGTDPLESELELMALLEKMGLRNWIANYRCQLAQLWDRRGEWVSIDEFLALNPHTERLLWQFGIFPWRTEDGQYRIEVPLGTDAVELLKLATELTLKEELPQAPGGTG